MTKNNVNITADSEFVSSWNRAFAKTFNWNINSDLRVRRDYWFKKIDYIAPWHPILFFDKEFDSNKIKCFKDKNNKFTGLFYSPEKNFHQSLKASLIKNNQLIHYINIENKNSQDLLKSFKSRTRTKVRSGLKKFIFNKISSYDELGSYRKDFRDLLIKQHLKFISPFPPIELIKNLLNEKAIEIHLAIYKLELVGFIVLSTDSCLPNVFLTIKSDSCKDNNLSICLYYICIEEAIKRKSKIISLGTTSSSSIAKFKEQLLAKRAILFNNKSNELFSNKDFQYFKSGRNIINLVLMNIMIRLIILLFKEKGFEVVSKQIWKRFD